MGVLRVWVLDEGHAGHLQQSLGLLDALQARVALRSHRVRAVLRVPGMLRGVLRWHLSGVRLPDLAFVERCYPELNLPLEPPDLLISSGGGSLPLAYWLRRRHACRHAYLGERRPFPTSWFDILLSPVDEPGGACWLRTDLLLTRPMPEGWIDSGRALRASHGLADSDFVAAMLIGGSSRSQRFAEADWLALAEGINWLYGRLGWRWLLTTSPRSGMRAESILREAIDPAALLDAVWWASLPRRVLPAYMAAANAIMVSGDSLSMISEAVAAGRPVIALIPRRTRRSGYLEAALGPAVASCRVARLRCDRLHAVEPLLSSLRPAPFLASEGAAAAVLGFMAACRA